jgi:hypothetical protein
MRFFLKINYSFVILLFLLSCASRKEITGPVLLRFTGEGDLGLVVHPVDWMRPAEQDNPGVDCTLRLEKQGPPENVYNCHVREGQNIYIVKLHEQFAIEPEDRRLAKVTVDSKWSLTRDTWIEDLRRAGFRDASQNPKGTVGAKWVFYSPDRVTQVAIFWNERTEAVSALLSPRAP